MDAALAGIVVTEIGGRTAAGFCGSLLAQLGATVVLVEGTPSAIGGKLGLREQFAAGKLSFVPDATKRHDLDLLGALVACSDAVLVSSDVDDHRLLDLLPAASSGVVCDITAFGASGAHVGRAYSEPLVQAMSGIADTTGHRDGPPVPIGVPIVDTLAGTYAASAVLAALRVRRRDGVGQRIDIAMFDCAFVTLHTFLSSVLSHGRGNTSRLGNNHPTVAPWGLYRSKDGWILICAGNQGQWERLCKVIGRPDFLTAYPTQALRLAHTREIDAGIEAWTLGFDTDDGVRRVNAEMVACGPIAPIDGYPREANLEYRGMVRRLRDEATGRLVHVPGSPFRMSATPGRAPERIPAPDADRAELARLVRRSPAPVAASTAPDRPLAGVRVIEIGQYTTAPLCARHLAHLGAEVVKVEQPGGDESRTWMPQLQGLSVSFRINNSDKRSLVLDLKTTDGRRALGELIRRSDVLIENMKPGALARLGFTPEHIAELNPRLVYCGITGFGADSLYANRPAFDMIIQAMSGFMTSVAPGAVPLKSGISTADVLGAVFSIATVLAALEYRDRSGRGQYVDLSMQDISAWLTLPAWNRDAPAPQPAVLWCADGYVVADGERSVALAALPAAVRASIGPDGRIALDRDALCAALGDGGVAAAPVLTVPESAHLQHTRDRGLWFTMPEHGVDWPMLRSPMRLERTPPRVTHLAPPPDRDRERILRELGLDAAG